ncbi:MAG: hypothetical protein HRU20_18580 [Pseudomonadales bacterium]|nr:hypothetical protein [Pseudomonadales bacterium]
MTMLLTLHLLALGIWIGVVGAEFVIEFDGMKDDESHIRASKLHYTTDIWVEIPAFMTVLITGLLMLSEDHLSGLFLYKVLFGLFAVAFNIVGVYAVFKRRKYAMSGDIEGMKSVDPFMKLSAAIIPVFLITFVLAMYIVVQ